MGVFLLMKLDQLSLSAISKIFVYFEVHKYKFLSSDRDIGKAVVGVQEHQYDGLCSQFCISCNDIEKLYKSVCSFLSRLFGIGFSFVRQRKPHPKVVVVGYPFKQGTQLVVTNGKIAWRFRLPSLYGKSPFPGVGWKVTFNSNFVYPSSFCIFFWVLDVSFKFHLSNTIHVEFQEFCCRSHRQSLF